MTRKKRKRKPFFATPSARLVGWWVGCAASAIDASGAGAGAVLLPTPGTEAWWRAAVGEVVYAPLEGPAQYVREAVN